MLRVEMVPRSFIQRAAESSATESSGPDISAHEWKKLALVAALCRINTLSEVKLAGSGHLGSSFSAMDIVVWLYYRRMNTAALGFSHPDRDIYFSSKGHDVPGQYAVLNALDVIPDEQLLRLRKLHGLDGHPNTRSKGIEANSGSLGMGISKARGMAWTKKLDGRKGWVYVLTGDGELQEGQNFEALQTAVQQGITGVTVIIDHNKLQTDKLVAAITDLGDLEAKFRGFGWEVGRCDGHDMQALEAEVDRLQATGRPHILIADTIKGKGVSFMEHPYAVKDKEDLYLWHSGAPSDEHYLAGLDEMLAAARSMAAELGLGDVPTTRHDIPVKTPAKTAMEFVAQGYGDALVDLAPAHPEIVVLDGDLSADCRVRGFETAFPDRFVENGIAEQDMASMAGGMALAGKLPFVNSFASFLCSRANEQIYTNACEGSKVVYGCHFAGMIPAGPGKSHQSVRDIGLLGSIPNLVIYQPASHAEAYAATVWAVKEARENVALRMNIGPSPRPIPFDGTPFQEGRGALLRPGSDALIIGYGAVMLNEALSASEQLEARGFGLAVASMPWLNRVDSGWLAETVRPFARVYVLEDHMRAGGLGERLALAMAEAGLLEGRSLQVLGLDVYPECGTPLEVLKHHGLDAESLAALIGGAPAGGEALGEYTDHAPQ